MVGTAADPLSTQRNVILGLLLALAAAAWTALLWQGRGASMDMAMGSLTMGLRAPLFLAIWVLMMAAMMLPTAAPMFLAFHRVKAHKGQPGGAFIATWLFVAGYLLVWTLAGVAAYAGGLVAEMIAARAAASPTAVARIGGSVLIAAGIYQLTPLKERCLAKCRAPIAFIFGSWRDGLSGALFMGLRHGAYCLGCCWLLFVILLPLGIMNIAAMAAVTLVILGEKTLPWAWPVSIGMAAALAVYGALVSAVPQLLPTFSVGAVPAYMPMPGNSLPFDDD